VAPAEGESHLDDGHARKQDQGEQLIAFASLDQINSGSQIRTFRLGLKFPGRGLEAGIPADLRNRSGRLDRIVQRSEHSLLNRHVSFRMPRRSQFPCPIDQRLASYQ
jgi:hypothetical protein